MKEDEKKFFTSCLHRIAMPEINIQGFKTPRELINDISEFINYKRCWYLLEKWTDKGFYEYGTTLDLGWFVPSEFKGEYLEIYNKWR